MALGGAGPALADCKLMRLADLPVTMRGHQPLITIKVNGKDARFIVDTGAFWNTMTPGSAAKYGLNLGPAPFGLTLEGVGGSTMNVSLGTAQDVTFADVGLHHVQFIVTDKGFGGEAGLIGQNFLKQFDVEYDFANGVIRLFKPEGCGQADLAYWVGPSQAYGVARMDTPDPGDPAIMSTAQINDQRIRVALDTGAYNSTLSLAAAARAGVHPGDPGVVVSGYGQGVTQRSYTQYWLAPFSSFKFGGEEIKTFKLAIEDMRLDFDMLLGADFFLAHRVFVSNSQHKVYFSYNGGPVFTMRLARSADTPPPAADTGAGAGATLDAEGYVRRAAAFVARREYDQAIADLTQAITLKPDEARYVYERGLVHRANLQPAKALDDFNAAIKLKPDYIDALLRRSEAWVSRKDTAAAKADLDAADKAAPSAPDTRMALARAYIHAGFEPEAIAELNHWIADHPKDDELAMALGERCRLRALRNEGLDLALADCNQALKLLQANPAILESRGLVRLRLGDDDKAIGDFSNALKVSPRQAWSRYGRGLAERKKGMSAQADADIAAAKVASPLIADQAAKRGLTP
jgi:tetratricopeptide (TPR) repeat protein/predicted aspartyl protease